MRFANTIAAVFLLAFCGCATRVPIIYSTDLFHPYGDPDDHYDLATLFSLPEFDVRAIVLDRPQYLEREMQPGIPALRQMFELTGRTVPYAVGLLEPLAAPDDPARDREAAHQQGIALILSTLREARERVVIFTTGSLADVAAAYNREPALFSEKVRAIYVNAGIGPDGVQDEYNVRCDPHAFFRIMTSGLPVLWFPCFGRDGYRTYFKVKDEAMIAASPAGLRRYFVYALTRSEEDPLAFLRKDPETLPEGPRNMWCTPAFLHAAGLEDVTPCTLETIRLRGEDDAGTVRLVAEEGTEAVDVRVFRNSGAPYGETMTSCLESLLADFKARKVPD